MYFEKFHKLSLIDVKITDKNHTINLNVFWKKIFGSNEKLNDVVS